ncbi:cryptochrome/photolyase family protein [Maritimibacter sp. DP1N21-5]|uniref:cryptochrome/photolyase family protein n=1 Tax=Maritimibacter sp. DP1N21-5 TaxID=2836867 RepID=UPI001C488EFB|nr:cryptochrome/photolyase family protein [Maritimibacter sp. DP1N21-5]MBV7408670.1 cryptochrome/photolyase family protein [Maritimibacter sp. DP1N21-5]
MVRLVLVLGDQLSPELSALAEADRDRDVVVMAEVRGEAGTPKHHPKKIALIFAAMRKFAARLQDEGWTVDYARLEDPANAQNISGELLRRAEARGAKEVLATTPGDWRLIEMLDDHPLRVTRLPDTRFIATEAEFRTWAKDRKSLRMEWFYREMRRKTGILMDGDTPAGGQWNFDKENRKPPRDDLFRPEPPVFAPDPITEAVLDLVEANFSDHFGDLRPFGFPTTHEDAERAARDFIDNRLEQFGTYQDAMLTGADFLYHSVLSPALNIGLLDPLALCKMAEEAYRAGRVPINSAEGFIRQILGWREYVRGIWALDGPGYMERNVLRHDRALPWLYWGGETRMACMADVVRATRENAYAHHIQRLMITGNFALIAGLDPAQVQDWYLRVYADAFEWVEAPNVVGMSLFADGGMLASKPYASSGSYIDRMSDYCGTCPYDVKRRTGDDACPFNSLYWAFLHRHADRFSSNPRMSPIMATWRRMSASDREDILYSAQTFLEKLDRGEPV